MNRLLVGVALAAASLAAVLATRAVEQNGDAGTCTAEAVATAVESAPELKSGDQYDLLAAITAAQSLAPEQADEQYAAIRRDWAGKRVHWRVFVIPTLCGQTDQCHVLPFDNAGKDRKVQQGWMPRLELDDGDLAAIEKSCAGQKRCQVEFEGTLDQFTLSTELFTNLTFSDVVIL